MSWAGKLGRDTAFIRRRGREYKSNDNVAEELGAFEMWASDLAFLAPKSYWTCAAAGLLAGWPAATAIKLFSL